MSGWLLATGGGGGPVIPNFGQGSACERSGGWFCTDWVRANWASTLQPALVQHIELTVIAVAVGFVIASLLAVVGYRWRPFDVPLGVFTDFLYTIPSLALFILLVPFTGLTVTTVEIALIAYTLFILYRNMVAGLRGVPEEALEVARGMGLTRVQTFFRVELPLASPAMFAGLRIATVSTVSIATVAAFVIPQGLGEPILTGLQESFGTEILAGSLLAILLALTADGLLALFQRGVTPWTRVR
jgi:osmoprotectant transport system permease protein